MSASSVFPSANRVEISKSPNFWKEDGDFVLIAQNGEGFKVHYDRLSTPKIQELPLDNNLQSILGQSVARLPAEIDPEDFTTYLEYLYSETDTIRTESRAPNQLCALIRVSSDSQLHDQAVQASSRSHLEDIIKPDTIGALDEGHIDHAEDILGIVAQNNIQSLRKRMLYTVATTSHFEAGPSSHPSLPTEITNLCASLQTNLISHFTPILFTVATASHMACTDVFAEKWMPLVIGPSLENNGLCRPVETLRDIQRIEWEKEGLCEECCVEKRQEWEDEIRTVWEKVDTWI